MITVLQSAWRSVFGRNARDRTLVVSGTSGPPAAMAAPRDIAPDDPIIAYFQASPVAIDIDSLDIDSPALAALKADGVKMAVPLVSQGEVIGLLNLGPRLSEQDYSVDD